MNQQERDEYLAIEWTGPGWKQLILDCDKEMSEIDPDYTIFQIKEKFGGLRYYVKGHQDLFEIKSKYERLSYSTCEECGSTEHVLVGNSNTSYWVKSLCRDCRVEGESNE